jgi:hypothetical protein
MFGSRQALVAETAPVPTSEPDEASPDLWQLLMNCYVALGSKRMVILRGVRDSDSAYLVQGIASLMAARPEEQCFLQAHPWWTAGTGAPGFWAMAHAQFNALKLRDFIEMATIHEAMARPFLICMEKLSPAELLCYFEHLPRGELWQPDGSTLSVRLPTNLYLVGTLGHSEYADALLDPAIYQYAAVISIPPVGETLWQRCKEMWPARHCGQRGLPSSVRTVEGAMRKLSRILPTGTPPLAPLAEVACRLRLTRLPHWLLRDGWLYLSNAFDAFGAPLLAKGAMENLSLAQDLFLTQTALPHLLASGAGEVTAWVAVQKQLARFPRAQALLADLLTLHPKPTVEHPYVTNMHKEARVMA